MENDLLYNTGCSIYPGEYIPLFEDDEINEKLHHLPVHKSFVPSQTVKELPSSYKIEVAVPGAKRENFILSFNGNILSIFVIHNDCEFTHDESLQQRTSSLNCFKHQIILPDNADPSFISAEYKAGVLRLYISKSKRPVKRMLSRIAIY